MNTLYLTAGLVLVAGFAIWLYGRSRSKQAEAVIKQRIAEEERASQARAGKIMVENRNAKDTADKLANGGF